MSELNIIDTNVFYGKWPFRKAGEVDISVIQERCAENNVDAMLIASVNSIFYEDPFEAEEELYKTIAGRRNVWQVMGVNPKASGWKADIQTAVLEFGIKALKIYPGYHGYSMQDDILAEVCNVAREYDLPIIIAGRVEDLRVSYMLHPAPIPLDKLGMFLQQFRENTFVLSNFSFSDIMGLRFNILSSQNTFVDMAGLIFISFPLEKLLKIYSPEVFLFGSQMPLYVQRGILNEVTTAKISPKIQEDILCGNARRVFKLDEE